MATARVLLLSGGYTLVSVLTTAFQPPPAPGSAAQAVVLGENVVRFQGSALSLPEITRMPGFEGTIFYNYGTLTVSNVRVDDGGRRLSPGLDGHRVRIDGREYPALFDASSTRLGHWLPVPAGTDAVVEILNKVGRGSQKQPTARPPAPTRPQKQPPARADPPWPRQDNGGVSWHGTVRSDTQITGNSTVHLSLAQLRASVEFDRGTAHVVIPATDTATAVTVLTTLLCGLYLVGIAAVCSSVHDTGYRVADLIAPGAQSRPPPTLAAGAAGDASESAALLLKTAPGPAVSADTLYGLRLFLADAAANSIGVCVSSLLLSYSLLQTLRTGIALVGSVWATAGVLYMLLTDAGKQWSASTIRMYIEVSLLSGIAVALGVYSSRASPGPENRPCSPPPAQPPAHPTAPPPVAQFSAIVFAIGAVGVSLRDTLPPPEATTNWYMDVAFRVSTKTGPRSPVGGNADPRHPPPQIYTLLVWAPALFAPAIYGSLIHYHDVLVSVSPPAAPPRRSHLAAAPRSSPKARRLLGTAGARRAAAVP